MSSLGNFFLFLGWLFAIFTSIISLQAGRTQNFNFYQSSLRGLLVTSSSFVASLICLGIAFCSNDYSNQYVWQYSEASMPIVYKISAIWGGMDGSMLLWVGILSIYGAVLSIALNKNRSTFAPYVVSVFTTSVIFFASVVLFVTNPFRSIASSTIDFIPPHGNGLNPLLQNAYMAVHPPMLYLGFTGFAVPYAFCIGALIAGSKSNAWIRMTRRWTLVAWAFLTFGIALGGHWAYLELGWGGFWAWDPVENASFLPWLTGTAFLHSVMIQERKNMLKFWNVCLVVLTYGLTVFGTFLTRSGIVQSVHSFASTDIGWVFLAYLAVIFLTTVLFLYLSRETLKPERSLISFLSRESAFLINNLIFLSICFSVLWGVMFPVLSEAIIGKKQTVGPPFFNQVTVPLFLALLFLMAVGPLIAWRKANIENLKKTFLWPFTLSLIVGFILIWAGVTEFYPVLAYCLSFFAISTVFVEFHRGYKVHKNTSTLFKKHRSRYGGYIVHIGVAITAIAITSSMAHKIEREFTLGKGESYQVGRFSLLLNEIGEKRGKNYDAIYADARLKEIKGDREVAILHPESRLYRQRGQEVTSEVALRMTLREDFYLVLVGTDNTGSRASFKLFINPLQIWVWVGVLIMMLGTVVVIIPERIKQ